MLAEKLAARTHLLVFEPEAKGHQPLFVSLLHSYAMIHPEVGPVTFLVAPDLAKRVLEEEKRCLDSSPDGRVKVQFLSETEIKSCIHSKLWLRSLFQWRCVARYLRTIRASRVCFLFLDHLQIPLALQLPLPNQTKISGILFRPSIYEAYSRRGQKIIGRLHQIIKRISYRLVGKNPRIISIMTLDPFFPESVIGKKYFGALLTHLPDPCVFERYDSCEVPELAGKFKKMLQGRRVFLLFGFLTERKGVLKILDAMKHLPGEVGKGICIIFAGKVSPEIRCNIDEVFKRQPVVEINGAAFLLIDRFLSDGELRRLVETADVLLAPYQNFVGSSGVLLWAAGAGKPVITQSYGLLGALTERYNLGKAVDTSDASALAEAIGSFALGESPIHWNKSKMSLLAETSNPDRFCRHFFRFS